MIDGVKITLRYPRTLHAALTKLAAANHRSINAEVVMAIEGHVASARHADRINARIERAITTKRAKGKR